MNNKNKFSWLCMSLVLVASILLTSCAAATQQAPTAAATQVPEAVSTATTVPTVGPQVGGTLVMAFQTAVDSLDMTKAIGGLTILQWVNSYLLARDPTTGKIVPYLAKSWTLSPDGLTYTFTLRDDVKFSDGTPLTADDYVWTINRILDPATKSYCANFVYQGTKSVAVVDTHTFTITLAAPNFYYVDNLADMGPCSGPMSKAYATSLSDDALAKAPVGTGPFKFVKWDQGVSVTLERNPDFTWGPAFTHGGPAYIQTVEYQQVSDAATQLDAVVANQVDYSAISTSDIASVQALGTYTILDVTLKGSIDSLIMNVTHPPLDDINVRKAINMALDRQVLVQVAAGGLSAPLLGVLTPNTPGYCADADSLGYGFDLAQAKTLMQQAGYTYGSDGMLQKDGKPLTMNMTSFTYREKLSTLVQEQLKALGINVILTPEDEGQVVGLMASGNFDLFAGGLNISNASVLNLMFNSAYAAGPTNAGKINDPALDPLLATMINTTDPAVNQKSVCDVQKLVMQDAYTAPLYVEKMYAAESNKVKGIVWPNPSEIQLFDAYFVNP
jgi:peptide/nickel transport system substrate-binding protein